MICAKGHAVKMRWWIATAPRRAVAWWFALPDPPYIEFGTAVATIVWAIDLYLHPLVLMRAPQYGQFSGISPSMLIALGKIAGAYQLVVFFVGGRIWRFVGCAIVGSFWATLAIGLHRAAPDIPGIIPHAFIATLNVWTALLMLRGPRE